MNILSLSKREKKVEVSLTSDELVKICNILYHAPESDRNDLFYQLNSEMMLARDLSQYGHMDNFCLEKIVESRDKIKKKQESSDLGEGKSVSK